jgi:hypothetical protein
VLPPRATSGGPSRLGVRPADAGAELEQGSHGASMYAASP